MSGMDIGFMALYGVLGLVFGSLSSLLSYRLPRDMPVCLTRSACPSCHHALRHCDLFPLLGYVLQKGKCRWCHNPIGLRYPAMEMVSACLFMFAFFMFGASMASIVFSLFSFALLVVIVSDLETYIIPDPITLLIAVLGIFWRWQIMPGLGDAFLGAFLGAALTLGLRALFLVLRRRQGLGLGDVKFITVAGIWLGLERLPWLLVLGGVFGVVFGVLWQFRPALRRRRKRGRKAPSYFPFGPSLALALYVLVLDQYTLFLSSLFVSK